MRRNIAILFALLAGFGFLLSRTPETAAAPGESIILYAGQNIAVGTVEVSNDADNLYATYKTDAGWCLMETHLHVGEDETDFPFAGNGKGKSAVKNVVPGQFDYKASHDCDDEHTYVIPLADLPDPEDIVVAAHAVVQQQDCEESCELLQAAPYGATNVTEAEQKLRKDGSAVREGRSNPEAVLTWDTNRVETDFYSLGLGGHIIVEFDNPIKNGVGYDVRIVEDTWGTYPSETANVWASTDGDEWVLLGEANNSQNHPDYNWQTVSDFELGGLAYARFIKVMDTTNPAVMPNDGDGFDLNAILALHDCEECEEVCEVIGSESAWAGNNRFTPRGNWATWFAYSLETPEVTCDVYDLNITSVNGNSNFTHQFELTFCPDKDPEGTGSGDQAGSQTITEIVRTLDPHKLSFRSDYSNSYYWFPSFNLLGDGTLDFVDGHGSDNVHSATGTWVMN